MSDAKPENSLLSQVRSFIKPLLEQRYMKVMAVVLLLFAMGLVFFFRFAADFGDGLEMTMEEGEAEEDPEFEAPLEYGDDYPHALLSGIIGFTVILVLVFLYGRITAARSDDTKKGE